MSASIPARPRVALLGFAHESNAFAPITTGEEFRATCYLEGDAILREAEQPAPAMPQETPGFIREMNGLGDWEPVPVLLTQTQPSGPVDAAFFHETVGKMETALRAAAQAPAGLHGVYVANHGAMRSTDSLDPDGDMLARLRAAVGPEVPIVCSLDYHTNLSQQMVDMADLLVVYRTNPHVDMAERGAESARALRELMGGVRPVKAFLRLPLQPIQTTQLTDEAPMRDLIAMGQNHGNPDILNVSIQGSFSYGDTPKQGLSVVVQARTDLAAARALARQIAAHAWEHRRLFTRTLMTVEQAVALAKELAADPQRPSGIFADVSDNPGGGGRGNTTWLLEAFVTGGVQGAMLAPFFDPALARAAHAAGEGATIQAHFNTEETQAFSKPFAHEATVLKLAQGPFAGKWGTAKDRGLDMGLCCALQVGGVAVVVVSHRQQCLDPTFFHHVGLDPAQARSVIVKSRGHFRAGFAHLFPPERVYEVDTPGLTSQNLASFPYQHRPSPMYPLEEDAVWTPPDWARG